MTSTDSAATALMPSRALGLIAALPPALIVAGAAALGYTQAPKLEPTISGFFAPPVAAYHAPAPPIDPTPVASIPTPAPPPVEKTPEVAATQQPLPVAPPVKHVARNPPAPRVAKVVKVIRVNVAPPQPHFVYPAYRSYQPTYVPVPIPFVGRGGGRMFGGLGGLFGRH